MTGKLHQAERSLALLDAGGVANRVMATTDGVTMAMQGATPGMVVSGVSVRAATRVVAQAGGATPSSAAMQAQADYLCDGTADEVEINAALTALGGSGGTVLIAEGVYTLAAPIIYTAARQRLQGMGMDVTTLRVVSAVGAPAIAAINTVMVQMYANYDEILDLTIDGNKAGNPTATGMYGLQVQGLSPRVERVHITNSKGFGMVTLSATSGGVVRDCLVELSDNQNAILRAAAGQPLVVSGCIFRSGATHGVNCDSGPVSLSDCQSISNAASGFTVSSTDPMTLTDCVARNNGSYGFTVAGSKALVSGCRSIANVDIGFLLQGAQAVLTGCLAAGTTGTSRGFQIDTLSTDTLLVGCSSSDHSFGYYMSSTGRASLIGCRAINSSSYGIHLDAGSAQVQGCFVSGQAGGGYGIWLANGSNHQVDGCRITATGGHGVYIGTNVTDAQVTNNYISDSSLVTNNTYHHLVLEADRTFVHGNVFRDPPSGNRPYGGIYNLPNADLTLLGLTNMFGGAGLSNPLIDAGTNTRRVVRQALDYSAAANLIAVGLTAGIWTDVPLLPGTSTTLSFRVDSANSLVEISVRGSILIGLAAVNAYLHTRLMLSGVPIKLGMAMMENGQYTNVLAGGGQTVKLQAPNITAGSYTLGVQVLANVAATAFCRAVSFPDQEWLKIQVTEFTR